MQVLILFLLKQEQEILTLRKQINDFIGERER